MQCEFCQNKEATIHLTEITDGVRTEMHLCEQCAQEQGIGSKSYIPLNELLSSLLSVGPKGEEPPRPNPEELVCPHCGYTLAMFQEKAVLGCPHDYEVFDKQLSSLIKKAHEGASRHCGKVPTKIPTDSKKEIEIARLKQQLDEAVKKEDYELAANLRDKLNELK